MLVFRIKGDQTKVVLARQILIKLENMLHSFILEKDAIKLIIDDEDDTLIQDIVVTQVLVDRATLSPADFRE